VLPPSLHENEARVSINGCSVWALGGALLINRKLHLVIPIKIQCGCGQKYAFDVEPDNGSLRQSVHCPVCGSDGVAVANQLIAQHLAAPPDNVVTAGARLALRGPPERLPTAATNLALSPADAGMGLNSRGRRAKWLLPTISAAIVLLFALAGVVFARSHRQKLDSASFIAEAGKVPDTLVELNALYVEPPAGQNAALFFLQGFDALQIGKAGASALPIVGKGKLPPPGVPLTPSLKSAVAAFLQSNEETLRLFAQARTLEQSRYPIDLTQGIEATFPHLTKVKSATQLLELSALFHAEGDGKAALDDVRTVLSLGHSLQAEPALLSQLLRVTCISAAVSALERTVNRSAAPATSWSELGTAFQRLEEYEARGEGFNRALAAERAISMSLLNQPRNLRQALAAAGNHVSAEQRAQILARLEAAKNLGEEQHYLQITFQQLLAARQVPFPERLKADTVLQERVAQATGKKGAIMGLLLPGLTGRTANEAESLAKLRLGCTVVALERFRATHDRRYPAALTELTPGYLAGPLADPFDGLPLRYRQSGDGYVLYSLGPDRSDDGGEPRNGKTGDIVFRIVSPPKPAE
jgi:hypothetical protein